MADSAKAYPYAETVSKDAKALPAGLLRPVARVPNGVEHHLFYGDARKPVFRVVSDAIHPGMWRVVHPDGSLSDMANLTRAKDAAFVMADRGPPRRNQSLLQWKTSPTALRGHNQPNRLPNLIRQAAS
jgi:hypothetical protein